MVKKAHVIQKADDSVVVSSVGGSVWGGSREACTSWGRRGEFVSGEKKDVFVCLILAGDISAAPLQFSVTRHSVILVASTTVT